MNEDMSIYKIKEKINKYTTYEIWRHNIRYSYKVRLNIKQIWVNMAITFSNNTIQTLPNDKTLF